MNKLEKIGGLIVVISFVIKFALWPGSSLLFLIGLLLVIINYFPFGVCSLNKMPNKQLFKKDFYRNIPFIVLLFKALLGAVFAMILVGLFLEIQHFGYQILLIGLFVLILLIVIMLFYTKKNKDLLTKRVTSRIIVIFIIGIFVLFMPRYSIEKLQYRNHPKYIEALDKWLAEPDNNELHRQVEIEYKRIYSPNKDDK